MIVLSSAALVADRENNRRPLAKGASSEKARGDCASRRFDIVLLMVVIDVEFKATLYNQYPGVWSRKVDAKPVSEKQYYHPCRLPSICCSGREENPTGSAKKF